MQKKQTDPSSLNGKSPCERATGLKPQPIPPEMVARIAAADANAVFDDADRQACDDALPEIERVLNDPNTRWLTPEETQKALKDLTGKPPAKKVG